MWDGLMSGKGDADTRSPNYKARREGYDHIFRRDECGCVECKKEKDEKTKEVSRKSILEKEIR